MTNKLLNPQRVRELMAAMQPKPEVREPVKKDKKSRTHYACEMIIKTSCSVASAAQSWGVSVKTILTYAKENNLPVVHKPWKLDEKAKQMVEDGSWRQGIPRGLKQRVAYEMALKFGTSEACRRLKISRRGLYYYCIRYNLPTPERSERRVRE
jgi:hypothetical protein